MDLAWSRGLLPQIYFHLPDQVLFSYCFLTYIFLIGHGSGMIKGLTASNLFASSRSGSFLTFISHVQFLGVLDLPNGKEFHGLPQTD